MLGRKQSLKGELILADYGPEESLNENADIEWVNKVILYFCEIKSAELKQKNHLIEKIIKFI